MNPLDGAIRTDQLLAEIKQLRHASDAPMAEDASFKVVVFTCGSLRLGLPGASVREILPPRVISWVPCLPDHLPGLINVRGDIEAVVDIRRILDAGTTDPSRCLIVMVVHGERRFALLIDTVEDVADVPERAVRPPLDSLSGAIRELVSGELDWGGNLVTLLDIEKLAARICP